MNFDISEDQKALQNVLGDFFSSNASIRELQALANQRSPFDSGELYDQSPWAQLRDQIAPQALHIPEALGGQGFGFIELGLAIEQSGRVLYPGPLLSSAILSSTLLLAGDPTDTSQSTILRQLASGHLKVAIPVQPTNTESTLRVGDAKTPELVVLDGEQNNFLFGYEADTFVATAPSDTQDIFLVDSQTNALSVTESPSIDPTRPLSSVSFDQTLATKIVVRDGRLDPLSTLVGVASTLSAAEQIGAAQEIFDLTVEYSKNREQFSSPIGSFQAVKHDLANMLIDIEVGRVAMLKALWSLENDPTGLKRSSALAGFKCTRALDNVASKAVQILGGIGFTWEHPAQLYFKRARASRQIFGQQSDHLNDFANR